MRPNLGHPVSVDVIPKAAVPTNPDGRVVPHFGNWVALSPSSKTHREGFEFRPCEWFLEIQVPRLGLDDAHS